MIEIYIDGRSLGVKGSGFSVFMRSGQRSMKRSVRCNNLTSNQMELKAIEYALKSIKDGFEKEEIIVKTSGRFVQLMLERHDDGWMRQAKTNPTLVDEVRAQWVRFSKISIANDGTSETMAALKKLTDDVIKQKTEIYEQI